LGRRHALFTWIQLDAKQSGVAQRPGFACGLYRIGPPDDPVDALHRMDERPAYRVEALTRDSGKRTSPTNACARLLNVRIENAVQRAPWAHLKAFSRG